MSDQSEDVLNLILRHRNLWRKVSGDLFQLFQSSPEVFDNFFGDDIRWRQSSSSIRTGMPSSTERSLGSSLGLPAQTLPEPEGVPFKLYNIAVVGQAVQKGWRSPGW